MNLSTSRKRHQMISEEFEQNDLSMQVMQSDEGESAVKKIKSDPTVGDPFLNDANSVYMNPVDREKSCSVEDSFNNYLPPSPLLFESSQSQDKSPTTVTNFVMDTQIASSSIVNENKICEKTMPSKKATLRTNKYFDPCDFVEDPNERRLPDLRANRADPVGYVALFPRKGEILTEESSKAYSEKYRKECDRIQEMVRRQQRQSLTYIKWAPPIDIPLETDISSLSLSDRVKNNRLSVKVQASDETENACSTFTNLSDIEDDDGNKPSLDDKTVKSPLSLANFKLQFHSDNDDAEDFQTVQNKKKKNRKKNNSGQQKNRGSLTRLQNNKLNQGEKMDVYSCLDKDDDEFPSLGIQKNLPKTYSRDQANRGGARGHNRRTVNDNLGEANKDDLPKIACPMCGLFFSSGLVEAHAFSCDGVKPTLCANNSEENKLLCLQSESKCDIKDVLACGEENNNCVEQNTETFELSVQKKITSKEMANSGKSTKLNVEILPSIAVPLKQLRVKLIDFRKQ